MLILAYSVVYLIIIFTQCLSFSLLLNSCKENSKFTTKANQFFFQDHSINLNIEFIDICHSLKNTIKATNYYYLVDNSIQTDDKLINFLKTSLIDFGFTIDNVLGKGNYGVVFSGNSIHYGNVAIKVASNKDGAFYDSEKKQECCYYPNGMCNACSKSVNQLLPFEVANAVLLQNAEGVVKTKAYGVISSYTRLLFYIIVMEKIENSMTLLEFSQKCFKRFNFKTRSKYIREAQLKLNEINKNLVKNFHIFHNDLKSDNILIRLNLGLNNINNNNYKNISIKNRCGNGKAKLDLYLIDFGNAILNVNRTDEKGNSILLFDQYKFKKYYIYYRAPDISCEQTNAKIGKLLSWYLGVIAFEMCANGIEHVNLAPSQNNCFMLKIDSKFNMNSFDTNIANNPKLKSLKLCFESNISNYLKLALNLNPNNRISSDSLMKTNFILSDLNPKEQYIKHSI